jgi:hypothetical protein
VFGVAGDCNDNGIDDACDIRDGTSLDDDGDGIPDECGCTLLAEPPAPEGVVTAKNRYLSFAPTNAGELTAIRVKLADLPAPFDAFDATTMWVSAPEEISEISGVGDNTPPVFFGARLVCDPVFMDWGGYDLVHVFDSAVVPGGRYEIQAIAADCDTEEETHYSAPLEVLTGDWGDLVGDCSVTPCTAPNGQTNFDDISALVDKFKNGPGAPIKARSDLSPDLPDRIIDFVDISRLVDAFRGVPYPFAGPTGCR